MRASVFFTSGSLGAIAVMSVGWSLGRVLHVPAQLGLGVLILGGLILAARDAGLVSFALPQRRGQVKRETMLEHPIGGLIAHGFALGTAFYTFIPVSLVYLVFVAPAAITPAYVDLVGMGVAFGLGRALPVFARMFLTRIDADRLATTLMTQGLPIARTISMTFLAVVAGWAAASLPQSLG
ncbi:MAG: hypothetical protein M3323_15615 [Actinomycetota bacterium]|nr:hypothetical protein [Actinomycetota bacterium]